MDKMQGNRHSFLLTKLPQDYFLNYHDRFLEAKPQDSMKHVPEVDMARQLDREKVSFVKEVGEYMKARADERTKQRYDLESKVFMLRRQHEQLLRYHGKTDFMLPAELKMRGKQRLYNARSSLHKPDPTIVETTKDSYKEGSEFITGVEKFILNQYEEMARDRAIAENQKKIQSNFDDYPADYK